MSDLAEYERRISYALERIGKGIEAAATRAAAAALAPTTPEGAALAATAPEGAALAATASEGTALANPQEVEDLREALEAERIANAQLSERVRAIRDKQETTLAALERKLAAATLGLDQANHELVRLKRANTELAGLNRDLTEASSAGQAEPHLINRAMQAELESLRAARGAEIAELDGLLGALGPLVASLPLIAPQAPEADHA